MNAVASQNEFTFSGKLWRDNRDHLVATFAGIDPDSGAKLANVMIQYERSSPWSWRLNYIVRPNDPIIFDGALYKVTGIFSDDEAKRAQETRLLPASADTRDSVSVKKIADGAFPHDQIVLPMAPSVLSLAVSNEHEVELIFDAVSENEEMGTSVALRWRQVEKHGLRDQNRAPYAQVEAKLGGAIEIPGLGKVALLGLVAASQNQPFWVVLKVVRLN